MLFSNDAVVELIRRSFEPVWESVRPVPIIRIDFGNGHVLTRTLNGNIATYACAADGQVLDILPGIYAPTEYQERLNQLRLLANFVDQEGPANRAARLQEYHREQLVAMMQNQPPVRFMNLADIGKGRIERPMKAILVQHSPANPTKQPADKQPPASDLAGWKALVEDTQHNETVRRKEIHAYLGQRSNVRPADMTKWLYKEVLHADLDDPHLGLGKVLFDAFAGEEGR